MNDPPIESFEGKAEQTELFDTIVADFEAAWLRSVDEPPDIGAFLKTASDQPAHWRNLLLELIVIDQEYRWKVNQHGRYLPDRLGSQPTWNDYRSVYSELGAVAEIRAGMVAEEYRVRRLWGDKPTQDAFLACYPYHIAPLVACLQAIDREIAADRDARELESLPQPTVLALPAHPFVFRDFLLQKHLGTGGIGKVYRAWQHSAQRTVAVKTIRKQHRRNPAAVASMVRELELMSELHHPAIVRVHGLGGYPGGGYFLVQEYIDGPDLQTVLERGPLPIGNAVRIVLGVAEAVEFAHQQGVLHCDLKPANILQSASEQLFVADFGFGHLVQTQPGASSQSIGGTWGYAAPEMLLPELGNMNIASDVFGMGALFYALLTGKAPRETPSQWESMATMRDALFCLPRRPSELRTEIPPALEEIVLRCLAITPAARYQSVGQFAEALAAWNRTRKIGG